MNHPSKSGWSRILYSTEVGLASWVPSFVVNYLTKTALLDSTAWVKEVSEAAARTKQDKIRHFQFPKLQKITKMSKTGANSQLSAGRNVGEGKQRRFLKRIWNFLV